MTQCPNTPGQGVVAYSSLASGAQVVQPSQNVKHQATHHVHATLQSTMAPAMPKAHAQFPNQSSRSGKAMTGSKSCNLLANAMGSNNLEARKQLMSFVAAPHSTNAMGSGSLQTPNQFMSFVAQAPSNTCANGSSNLQAPTVSKHPNAECMFQTMQAHNERLKQARTKQGQDNSPVDVDSLSKSMQAFNDRMMQAKKQWKDPVGARERESRPSQDVNQNLENPLHKEMAIIVEDVPQHLSEVSDTKVVNLPPECIREEVVHSVTESASCESSECQLKLALFDFDCTLTSFHVFGSLAGAGVSPEVEMTVPPPKARTELGQMSRLCALDADQNWGPGVFAFKAFGGNDRVSRLRSVLEELEKHGVECIILSRGMVGPTTKCLTQVNLHTFFSQIIGNVGSACGHLAYDYNTRSCEGGEHLLGKPDSDIGRDVWKFEHIKRLMELRELKHDQVVFMDDSLKEIEAAQGHCRRIHVECGKGAEETEFKLLQQMLPSADSATIKCRTWSGDTSQTTITGDVAAMEAGSAVRSSGSNDVIGETNEQPKVPKPKVSCEVNSVPGQQVVSVQIGAKAKASPVVPINCERLGAAKAPPSGSETQSTPPQCLAPQSARYSASPSSPMPPTVSGPIHKAISVKASAYTQISRHIVAQRVQTANIASVPKSVPYCGVAK